MARQTPEERRKLIQNKLPHIVEHVSYEVRMLIFCAEYVGGCHGSPVVTPDGDQKNVALESFLLHFRNLRDFLCPSLLKGSFKPDDAFASDFTGKFDCSDVVVEPAAKFPQDEQDRLNKMLAHISVERLRYVEARDYNWDTAEMLARLVAEWRKFVEELTDEPRGWFSSTGCHTEDAVAHVKTCGSVSNVSNSTVSTKHLTVGLHGCAAE